MVNQKKILMILLCGCGILLWTFPISVKAQFREPRAITGIKPRGPKLPKNPPVKTVREEVIVVKPVMTRTSNLTVTTEPGATVFLESVNSRKKRIDKQIAGKEGAIVFDDLPAATYKIKVEKNGFETKKQDEVKIPSQQTVAINMDINPITSNLTIKTNVGEGEVRYASGVLKETKPDGSVILEEKTGSCIVPIINNKAVIKGLKTGYYNIDIRPSRQNIEYDPKLTAVNVSNETTDADVEVILEKKISEGIFNTAWASDDWAKPPGWKSMVNKMMKTEGLPGIALPSNEDYRYYTDFEMKSDVRLLNADTIGFVVRALNDKNYYLFQFSGAKAETPHVFKSYIVEDGKERQLDPSQSITGFDQTLAKGNFRVIIKAKNNFFEVFIEDIRNAGIPKPVGKFTDENETFKKGAVGIAARKNGNFDVLSFTVCPRACN